MEVVFEILIKEDNEFQVSRLLTEDKEFRNRFPAIENIRMFEGQIPVDENKEGALINKLYGYTYKSADGKELAQFRSNGFAYNKLGDYPGGDEYIKSALSAWALYAKCNPNASITRLGLRFINVITVNGFDGDYQKYFWVYLNHSDAIGNIDMFQYRYSKDFPELGCKAVVGFNPAASTESNQAKFLFDIDVLKDGNVAKDEMSINDAFMLMRNCKNMIFFATLNNKLLEQYK